MANAEQYTVEFYEDPAHQKMIGAVYLDAARLRENMEHVGRSICAARKLNWIDCLIYDQEGTLKDSVMIFRRR